MKRNSIVLILATLMVFSSLAVAMGNTNAGSSNSNSAMPQLLKGATEVGNVYIYANGTVSNTSAVQQVGSTGTYNLLVNINGTLSVERNNTVLEGNGLTLTGGDTSSNSGALVSFNTTNITINRLVIGSTSYYGIQMGNVANLILENLSTVNFTGHTLIEVYYSSSVTIENGNFSFSSTTYGIDAEYDTSLNVSHNRFSGYVSSDFVYFEYSGVFRSYNNVILSTDSYSPGFYLYYDGPSVFAYNSVNNSEYGFYVEYSGSSLSMHNYVSNYSSTAFYESFTTSFTSWNDTAVFGADPVFAEDIGSVFISGANYSNFTTELEFEYYGNLTMENSQMKTSTTGEAILLYEGGNANLVGDTINMSATSNGYAVHSEYISGWVSLASDYIYAPSGYGFYLTESPTFNLTDSYLNASYGIYVDNYAVSAATITNNTFYVQNGDYATYMYDEYTIYNVNFSNNTVISPYNDWGYSGIYLYSIYTTSNITVSGNSFLNNKYPVYLAADSSYYGTNAKIQGNVIVNSTYAIEDFNYFNSVITSNTIINVTGEGIYIYTDGPGANISNNLVENMPGFGGMSYGIDMEYIYGGTNIISHNTVLNTGSSGTGIYVYYSFGTILVYSNVVANTSYGFFIYYNNNVLFFGNSVTNASDTGIYSYENGNTSYYSNTVINGNTSFVSADDFQVFVFANTFIDTQKNNSGLSFLTVGDYYAVTFYHNNFINATTNSTTSFSFYHAYGPLFMNMPLPVGGNFYSNYTGTGTNGIGSTPMNLSGTVQDMYPLTYKWNTPTVTFLENGLPSGTHWSVKFGSNLQEVSGSSAVFQQTNGLFSTEKYSVMNVPGYVASTVSGTVDLNGASNVVTIDFTPVTYGVAFTESGLSSGTSWSVTFNGNKEASTGSTISFSAANGTYSYTIGAVAGFTPASSSGTVTVRGASTSVSMQFTPVLYNLTIDQTGLPSGDTWTVSVGGKMYNSTTSSMVIQLHAGEYNVSVSGPSGYTAKLSSGNITVTGALSLTATFTSNARNATSPSAAIYEGLAGGVIAGGLVGALGTMLYTGTGIFRKLKG